MKGYVLTVERFIEAPPTPIFDLLSDPSKHALIDGSGMLQGLSGKKDSTEGTEPLGLGSTFGMGMKMGVRYTTLNRVVEFEPNRRIAWQTGPDGTWGRFVAGRIWRYELESTNDGTLVRESWDITGDHQRVLLKLGGIYSGKTRRNMEQTLARLDAAITGSVARD
ncbi:MAG: SRPBCC family protein [Acidimicrobiales bacterium]